MDATEMRRLANGDELVWPGCLVCQVSDGKITRMDEYLDSTQLKRLQ